MHGENKIAKYMALRNNIKPSTSEYTNEVKKTCPSCACMYKVLPVGNRSASAHVRCVQASSPIMKAKIPGATTCDRVNARLTAQATLFIGGKTGPV